MEYAYELLIAEQDRYLVLKHKKTEWAIAAPFLLIQAAGTTTLCLLHSPSSILNIFAVTVLVVFVLCILLDLLIVFTKGTCIRKLLRKFSKCGPSAY